MAAFRVGAGLGRGYQFSTDDLDGRPVVRARCHDQRSGFRVTLTFPVHGEAGAVQRLQRRLVRAVLRGQREGRGSA